MFGFRFGGFEAPLQMGLEGGINKYYLVKVATYISSIILDLHSLDSLKTPYHFISRFAAVH